MTQQRLLVLDDDETVGELLVAVARLVGFEARLCSRPQAFFDSVLAWSPTHLAIDLTMPEMDGIEVIRQLAADDCPARIIISSGAGGHETNAAIQQARGLGLRVSGVLTKPFSLASFKALLAASDEGIAPQP